MAICPLTVAEAGTPKARRPQGLPSDEAGAIRAECGLPAGISVPEEQEKVAGFLSMRPMFPAANRTLLISCCPELSV